MDIEASVMFAYLRASGTVLPPLEEAPETVRVMSAQICSACENKQQEVASLVKPEPGRRGAGRRRGVTHLHGLAAEEVNVWPLLVHTLADEKEERWEEFFPLNGVAAVDGSERVLLQLGLCMRRIMKVMIPQWTNTHLKVLLSRFCLSKSKSESAKECPQIMKVKVVISYILHIILSPTLN